MTSCRARIKKGKDAHSSDEGNRLRSRDEECPNIKDVLSTVLILLASTYKGGELRANGMKQTNAFRLDKQNRRE